MWIWLGRGDSVGAGGGGRQMLLRRKFERLMGNNEGVFLLYWEAIFGFLGVEIVIHVYEY